VRPFVGWADQRITIFDDRLVPGLKYEVRFRSKTPDVTDWSQGKAVLSPDLADGQLRRQLRVSVPHLPLGPAKIIVFHNGERLFALSERDFTITAAPIPLHELDEWVDRDGYQAGVSEDGVVYIAVDVSQVSGGTTFTGAAVGYPLRFEPGNVTMYNAQGFLMQLLDSGAPGLFHITPGSVSDSDSLAYWRHEFRTYKAEHRLSDAYHNEDDPDWHADGTPHIDHDHIVVAIAGRMPSGQGTSRPQPGATPPFQLVVTTSKDEGGAVLDAVAGGTATIDYDAATAGLQSGF
jgi:hypothetical protein